jgi:hypothetical protein
LVQRLHWRFRFARRSRIVRVYFHQIGIISTHRKIGHSSSISYCSRSQAVQHLNQITRGRRKKHREGYNMLGCKDPSSSPNGLIFQSPSLRKTFSLRITLTTMQWSYLVLSRDFWSTISWWTQAVQQISSLQRFRQMQEPDDKIHDATHPLCGFGGRQIVALGKITMPVTFGYIHNTRTEQVVFNIVDMEYPYNAIIGRGTLNAFEAILHPAYLCIKIPSKQGPIDVHGSQDAARRAEGSWTDSKAIHNIDETKAYQQYKHKREKAASADQPKPMLLCEDIAEQKVLLGSQLSNEQEKTLLRFLFNNKDVAEPPELFQLKCPSPALEARPHLKRNKPSVPRI